MEPRRKKHYRKTHDNYLARRRQNPFLTLFNQYLEDLVDTQKEQQLTFQTVNAGGNFSKLCIKIWRHLFKAVIRGRPHIAVIVDQQCLQAMILLDRNRKLLIGLRLTAIGPVSR